MIEHEQLAEALAGLDARDREVLDYSLRRRVPDEDLGSVFGVDASEVARMRAGAVERLSNQLGVQRGEDLGHVLRLLLEASTWDRLPAASTPGPPPVTGHRPVGAEQHEPPSEPADPTPPSGGPVLGMLADRPDGDSPDGGRRAGGRRLVAGFAVALAVLAPAGMVAALTGGDGDDPAVPQGSGSSESRVFKPQPEAVAEPFPTDPQTANRYPVARVRRTVKLLDAPGGRLKVRIGPKTEFDSSRVLSIVRRRGKWLAVLVPELENGEVGWIHQDKVSGFATVAWSMHVDLSKRRLVVRKNGRTVRSARIGVGRVEHPTPKGRYAVTDKLRITQPGSPYGCCVLALTGHQTKLPPGWPGGDRLAMHATRDVGGLGKAVSLGCMRMAPRHAAWMLKRIPLGTPVFVRG